MNSRSKTAWAELLTHCAQATGSTPTRRWLAEADKYVDAIGDLYLFIKLSHWFPLVDPAQMATANATILKGFVWLCSKSEDPAIALAVADLALASYKKTSKSGGGAKIGNACLWSLGHMPIREGTAQLAVLKDKIKVSAAQKAIARALAMAPQH